MVRDINLFFDSEKKEYVITSEKFTLRLNEEEFNSIKKTINGISYALYLKSKEARNKGKNSKIVKQCKLWYD